MAFLAQLAVGNHTVFAPTNAAFAKLPAAQLANRTLGAEIVAYHVLNNTYTPDGIAVAPAHTIARSLLNFGGYALPGNHSAPVVLTRTSNTTNTTSPFEIVQATDNVTVTGPVNAANLQVYIIHEVLAIPESVELTVNAIDMPLAGLLNATTFYYRLDPIRAPAITIFAPEPQAVMAANNLISTLNSTDIYRVLDNHIINGSIVYSTDLTSRNYTSQGGEPFMFSSNATGVFVTSGMTTARIIQSDTVLQNGVVHVGRSYNPHPPMPDN